jgi:hypothetical protein
VEGEAIDTSGLVQTLDEIAALDPEAMASMSSDQVDTWLTSLQEWHDYQASQAPQGYA